MNVLVNYELIQPTHISKSHLRPKASSASWMCLTRRASVSRKRLASTILFTSMRVLPRQRTSMAPPISTAVSTPTSNHLRFATFQRVPPLAYHQRGAKRTKIVYDDLRRHALSKIPSPPTPTAEDRTIAARIARFPSASDFAHDFDL